MSLLKLLLCLLVFHKSVSGTSVLLLLPHTEPTRAQTVARVSRFHSVSSFLSLLQAQTLSSCCHLLLTLLLRSYNSSSIDGSSSCRSFSTSAFIMHLSLVYSCSSSESKVWWWGFHLSTRVSLRFQTVLAPFHNHHSGLDSRALAYLLQTYPSALLQLKNSSNLLESRLAIT